MVHQYKNNGYNIVLDVNSGAVHVVDDAAYDVISLWESHTKEEIAEKLQSDYDAVQIKEAIEETASLAADGTLFRKMHMRILLRKIMNQW